MSKLVVQLFRPASAGRGLKLLPINGFVLRSAYSAGEGRLTVDFPDRSITLVEGDCVRFDGHLPHAICRVGDRPAKALILVAQDLLRRGDD